MHIFQKDVCHADEDRLFGLGRGGMLRGVGYCSCEVSVAIMALPACGQTCRVETTKPLRLL